MGVVSLTFALTMMLSEVPMLIASLGRVSGQLLGGRFLPMIILSREVSLS